MREAIEPCEEAQPATLCDMIGVFVLPAVAHAAVLLCVVYFLDPAPATFAWVWAGCVVFAALVAGPLLRGRPHD